MKKLLKRVIFLFVGLLVLIGTLFVMNTEVPFTAYFNPKTRPIAFFAAKHELDQIINKKFVLAKTYEVKDKQYALELYVNSNYKSFAGFSSSHGFAEAYVVLKDVQGNVLLEPHWYASCDFLLGDLRIDWDENKVYFTKFNYIDLTSMSYDCY